MADDKTKDVLGDQPKPNVDLRDLSTDELKHLSMSTAIGVKSDTDATAKAAQPMGKPASDVLSSSKKPRKPQPKKKSGNQKKWMVPLFVVAGIVVVVALMLPFLPNGAGISNLVGGIDSDPVVGEPTPTPDVSDLVLGVDDLSVDSDGDAIPDKLELILGYDPENNDCVRNVGCGDFPTLPRARLRLNLVFLLDASGSMGEEIGDQEKWDSAIAALRKVLAANFPGFTDVGLVAYGHKGSSSPDDQQVSCEGVEVIAELTPWRSANVISKTEGLGPTGWTPLQGALRQAGEMLRDREGEGNFIVVLSDGKETCGGDPIEEARLLKESGIEVTTNVVGLAVSDDERAQLEAIATAGGGEFFPAESPEELEHAVFLSSDVVRLWNEINQCIVDHLIEYGQCVDVQYLKSIRYLKEERLRIEEEDLVINGGSGTGAPKAYSDLERKIWEVFEKLRNENWEQYVEDLNNLGLN